jgi:hypothetical protein
MTRRLAMSAERLDQLRRDIADVLENEIRPLLPSTLGTYKLTLLARVPGRTAADILVTEESNAAADRLREALADER